MISSWLSRSFPRVAIDRRALILLNTPLTKSLVAEVWDFAGLRICADGAADRLRLVNPAAVPDVLVGDFDSVSPESLSHYRALGSDILNQSNDQDTTDLDKALAVAVGRGYNEAIILGKFSGSEGRLDHTFATIQALFMAQKPLGRLNRVVVLSELSTMQLLLPSDGSDITTLETVAESSLETASSSTSVAAVEQQREHVLEAIPGCTCGLIPIAGPCADMSSEGLKWDLSHSKLGFGTLISTSNVALQPQVRVRTDAPLVWTMTFPPLTETG
jgi:thiamine pyrophosphokinase